ncbi:MAG: hypothetical protein LBR26_06045 [Prevotella sp.]|jgi:hypothetical protein|nr:hypothetical protein [Prevotella sp.]
MIKKRNLRIVAVVTLSIMLLATTVFAGSYGTQKTVNVTALGGWQGGYSSGSTDLKESASTSWRVNVASKTMTSSPNIRPVNNANVIRGTKKNINGIGVFVGAGNTGTAQSNYWGQVEPAINQVATDSIRFSLNMD